MRGGNGKKQPEEGRGRLRVISLFRTRSSEEKKRQKGKKKGGGEEVDGAKKKG